MAGCYGDILRNVIVQIFDFAQALFVKALRRRESYKKKKENAASIVSYTYVLGLLGFLLQVTSRVYKYLCTRQNRKSGSRERSV